MGIPAVKSIGIRPVRNNVTQFGDGNNHLLYLRISKPADTADQRPYPFTKIAADRERYRSAVMKKRQSLRYKQVRICTLQLSSQQVTCASSI